MPLKAFTASDKKQEHCKAFKAFAMCTFAFFYFTFFFTSWAFPSVFNAINYRKEYATNELLY